MSGSDIKEACRDAAMGPVREYIRRMKKEGKLKRGVDPKEVRGLRTEDFFGRNKAARDLETLDDAKNSRDAGRRIHTTEESEDGSSVSTESGEERFRDSAYHDADADAVR